MTQYITRSHNRTLCQLWTSEPRYTEDQFGRSYHHRLGLPPDEELDLLTVWRRYLISVPPGSKWEGRDGIWVCTHLELRCAVSELKSDLEISR